MNDITKGLMQPLQRQQSATLNSLRTELGPQAAQTLDDQLEALSESELSQVQQMLRLLKQASQMSLQFLGQAEPYDVLIKQMYPRLPHERVTLLLDILQEVAPLSEAVMQRPKQKTHEDAQHSVLDDYIAALGVTGPKSTAEQGDISSQPVYSEQPQYSSNQQSSQSLLQRPIKSQSFTGKQDFISRVTPVAKEVAANLGISHKIVLAQAALESGWGRSVKGNNLMGIKSHGEAGGVDVVTHEVLNGKRVKITDSFRQYASPEDSIRGYGDFLKANSRYRHFLGAGVENEDAQLSALQSSGYATDPKYAHKLKSIINSLPEEEG